MAHERPAHGVLVVDKPRGPTSHDVVGMVRRALGTRSVGHAGTLDPMATGVLVVAIGEGTKLVRWLMADDKVYRAKVALGAETDTLDAEGRVVERAAVPEGLTIASVAEIAAGFVGTIVQRPPAFSAIKVDGRPLYERARRGEAVDAEEREVHVRRLAILALDEEFVELEVEASKGFYVRSLGRDLARALGTCGHLSSLRRIRSGAFGLEGAVDEEMLRRARLDESARGMLLARVRTLSDSCVGMPRVTLDDQGLDHASHGRPIALRHAHAADSLVEGAEPLALLDASGSLVAVGALRGGCIAVVRGIRE